MERRRADRYPTALRVTFLPRGSRLTKEGHCYNVSLLGCALQADLESLESNGELVILPFREEEPIVIQHAVIRWSLEDRHGVDFMAMFPRDKHRLTMLISELRYGRYAAQMQSSPP
jgi:PilZ domain